LRKSSELEKLLNIKKLNTLYWFDLPLGEAQRIVSGTMKVSRLLSELLRSSS
jgi:hypothetical protein